MERGERKVFREMVEGSINQLSEIKLEEKYNKISCFSLEVWVVRSLRLTPSFPALLCLINLKIKTNDISYMNAHFKKKEKSVTNIDNVQ